MLVSSGEAQLVTITVMANTELIIVTFLICVQSEEPHDLIYSVSNVRNTTQSLQWKCSGICIFFLCRCSQLKVFSDIKWIIEKIMIESHEPFNKTLLKSYCCILFRKQTLQPESCYIF